MSLRPNEQICYLCVRSNLPQSGKMGWQSDTFTLLKVWGSLLSSTSIAPILMR